MNEVNDLATWLGTTDVDGQELVDHPDLNRMLDPIRATRPIEFRCGADRCNNLLAYWALHTHGARVVPGPKRRKKGQRFAGPSAPLPPDRLGRPQTGYPDITGGWVDLDFGDFSGSGRFELPIEWAMKGTGSIRLATNPNVASPWPLRWSFICPRDAHSYPYTNKRMVQLFVREVRAPGPSGPIYPE